MLNSIRWPPLRPATPSGRALAGTKTSPSPASPDTKPKPFSESKNFTLPVGTVHLFVASAGSAPGRAPATKANRSRVCRAAGLWMPGRSRPAATASARVTRKPGRSLSVTAWHGWAMSETTENRKGQGRETPEPRHADRLTLRGFWNAAAHAGSVAAVHDRDLDARPRA